MSFHMILIHCPCNTSDLFVLTAALMGSWHSLSGLLTTTSVNLCLDYRWMWGCKCVSLDGAVNISTINAKVKKNQQSNICTLKWKLKFPYYYNSTKNYASKDENMTGHVGASHQCFNICTDATAIKPYFVALSWNHIKIQANGAMPILLMIAKTVFQVAVNNFHFLQNTPESIKNNHSCFLQKSAWSSSPELSRPFDQEFFCHPAFLITFKVLREVFQKIMSHQQNK